MAKITLEELALRKQQGNLDKVQVKVYNSKELGGEIELVKIPLKKYLEMTSGINMDNPGDNIELMCNTIFESCPFIKNNSKELMEIYDAKIPTDLPLYMLNENMKELTEISELINSFFGIDKVVDTTKN